MIQDIYPHRLFNQYNPSFRANDESIVICFKDGEVLINGDLLPKVKDLAGLDKEKLIYLFSIDKEKDYYLLEDATGIDFPQGYNFVSVSSLRSGVFQKKYRLFVIYTAWQLANWYRNNKFCGRCGKPSFLDYKERAIRCSCGNVIYPRINPAVIVGIKNGDKLLVTKYRQGYKYYALVAGFTEIGETLEETVAREVMEEVGLKVKNIRYYKSQPWGIAEDILAGFYCDVDGDDTITMDQGELKVAQWVTRDEIELQPEEYSLTNEMMMRFKDGQV